jgi:hypothetical protein
MCQPTIVTLIKMASFDVEKLYYQSRTTPSQTGLRSCRAPVVNTECHFVIDEQEPMEEADSPPHHEFHEYFPKLPELRLSTLFSQCAPSVVAPTTFLRSGPEHSIMESGTNNQRRKICNGQRTLVHDGFSYHPCPHGRVEKLRKCILPLHRLEDNTPDFEEQTSTAATTDPDPLTNDATAHKFDQITPTMAQDLIDRYRGPTTELGCWQSKTKWQDCRVILRNIAVRPWMRQLALIATNRIDD